MEAYSGSAFRSENENENVRRYALAVLAAIVALLLRRMLTPLLGESYPYHTLWAATVFCAWYCGLGPLHSHSFGWGGRDLVLVPAAGPFLRASRSQS